MKRNVHSNHPHRLLLYNSLDLRKPLSMVRWDDLKTPLERTFDVVTTGVSEASQHQHPN
jgi:hypothetical protein